VTARHVGTVAQPAGVDLLAHVARSASLRSIDPQAKMRL